jgi:MoxR-like ATPase
LDIGGLTKRPAFYQTDRASSAKESEDDGPTEKKKTTKMRWEQGVLGKALLEGHVIHFDNVDYLSADQQSVLLELIERRTVQVPVDGVIETRPFHPNARIILSYSDQNARGKKEPQASFRMKMTEVFLPRPEGQEILDFVPTNLSRELADAIGRTLMQLDALDPSIGASKIQKIKDFSSISSDLSAYLSPTDAVAFAVQLVFPRALQANFQVPDLIQLHEEADAAADGALWAKLLGVTQKDIVRAQKKTGFDITPSVSLQMLVMALAHKLGKVPLMVGPPSAGKTAAAPRLREPGCGPIRPGWSTVRAAPAADRAGP